MTAPTKDGSDKPKEGDGAMMRWRADFEVGAPPTLERAA
jgi:hypothetical protein